MFLFPSPPPRAPGQPVAFPRGTALCGQFRGCPCRISVYSIYTYLDQSFSTLAAYYSLLGTLKGPGGQAPPQVNETRVSGDRPSAGPPADSWAGPVDKQVCLPPTVWAACTQSGEKKGEEMVVALPGHQTFSLRLSFPFHNIPVRQ